MTMIGFEIPSGKIPLDGHFSTEEVEEIVAHVKEEGILKEAVGVKIVDENGIVGDRIEISEEQPQETGSENQNEKTIKENQNDNDR